MALYWAFTGPPKDHERRLNLCMWQIEYALHLHRQAQDYEPAYAAIMYEQASAMVRMVTGQDDETAHRALNDLEDLQRGPIGEYEAELDRLARMSLVHA